MPVRRGTTAVSFRVGSTAVAAMWRGAEYYSVDNDAAAYIAAVEAADAQKLEPAVARAINDFVVGCKADGIWSAIKASCILMGARTLSGALVPLAGTAPTNNNFVSADYNRKTGLIGDGSTKYLDSNRNNNADPQNSYHQAVYLTTVQANGFNAYIGAGADLTGSAQIFTNLTAISHRNRSGTLGTADGANVAGLIGTSRAASDSYTLRANGVNGTSSLASQTPFNGSVLVFARNSGTNVAGLFTTARMRWYSIGESLDLALLDARVSALYTAIGAAIP